MGLLLSPHFTLSSFNSAAVALGGMLFLAAIQCLIGTVGADFNLVTFEQPGPFCDTWQLKQRAGISEAFGPFYGSYQLSSASAAIIPSIQDWIDS